MNSCQSRGGGRGDIANYGCWMYVCHYQLARSQRWWAYWLTVYRETSSFANYLNTLGRSFLEAVVECWNERLYPSLSKEFLSRLLVHPPCRVKSHFLMSFKKGEYQHAFPVDWGGNMHGGLPLRVRIWWKNEEKKNPVNMSDSQQARADAWLHSRNPPSGERVKWNRKSRQCS